MVKLTVAAEFTGGDSGQTVGAKTLREGVHEAFAINRPVAPLLLELDNAITDEPVPQGQPDIDGLGREIPRLLVDLNDRDDQRLEVALRVRLFCDLPTHRLSASMSWALSCPRVSAIWASSFSYSGRR